MTEEQVREFIKRRRRQTIVHRIIYYCFDSNIISDHQYTEWENELKAICKEYPEIAKEVEYYWLCPSHTVGSSDIKNYPDNLVGVAKSLLKYNKK
jgi:NAD-dependent DNA ligase